MSEQTPNPLAPIMESFARWLTPARFLACVNGCLLALAILSLITWRLEPLALGVVAWFLPRLWRG